MLDSATPASVETEIRDLLHEYCRTLDEQRFHDWLHLFTEDGSYSVQTHENRQDQGLVLLKDDGLEALKERVGYVMGYWQSPRGKTLHTVTNLQVVSTNDRAALARSYLVVYRTGDDGVPRLYTCAETEDILERQIDGWRIRRRRVTVDNGVLPPNFTELL